VTCPPGELPGPDEDASDAADDDPAVAEISAPAVPRVAATVTAAILRRFACLG
jgi:hypothetical protein